MNVSIALLPVAALIVLALTLANIRRFITNRVTYGAIWAVSIAIALGCGYMIA
jgi:hypothetical protein